MTNKQSRRIEFWILALTAFITAMVCMSASAQDTTRVWFDSPSGYEDIVLEVPVSFEFQEPTLSIEGLLKFDDEKARYIGMEISHSSALAFDNHAGVDSVRWAISWSESISAFDTLLTFKFLPEGTGSFIYNLSFLEFDERLPANDGVAFVPGQTEIYPFESHPGFVNTEDYIEKLTACDWIRNFTMLKTDAGDASGNGDISGFDGSLVLQRVVGLIDSFPAQDSTIKILPAFCHE